MEGKGQTDGVREKERVREITKGKRHNVKVETLFLVLLEGQKTGIICV